MASHVYSKDKVMEVQFAEPVSPRSFFQKLANVGVTAAEHLAAVQPLPGNRYESIFKSVALCKQFHPQIRDLDGCTVTKFNDITVVIFIILVCLFQIPLLVLFLAVMVQCMPAGSQRMGTTPPFSTALFSIK